jgi:alkylation response protein AidB-like acyl-CoA dehydrogenase
LKREENADLPIFQFATRSAHEIADEAVQIFGGRALTQTGMGKTIEMFHRTYKFDAILGGAEGKHCHGCMKSQS